jgi:DNA-binding NarL/FixJ family response regulator
VNRENHAAIQREKMSQLRIFLGDPDRDGRLGLQMLLEHEPGLRIVGIAVRAQGLLGQVGAAQPDVILLDWQLIASAPKEYIRNLHSIETQPNIIILDVRPEVRHEAEAVGADGFVSKDSPPDKLLMILHELRKEKINEKLLKKQ